MLTFILTAAALASGYSVKATPPEDTVSFAMAKFLERLDAGGLSFARYECEPGEQPRAFDIVRRHLMERHGSPARNGRDMVVWDHGDMLITLQPPEHDGRQYVTVTFAELSADEEGRR